MAPKVKREKETASREPTEKADGWQYFHFQFMQLAHEEEQFIQANRKDTYLLAHCDYQEHPEILYEKGKPAHGWYCLLKAPETGVWMLGDGVSENFQARFRALVVRAGLALGCPQGTDPEDFWLHRLYFDLRENRSKLLFGQGKTDPDANWLRRIYPELPENEINRLSQAGHRADTILRVCETSATFCSRLEKQALGMAPVPANTNAAEPVGHGHVVAKRAALVKENRYASASEMCKIFDREKVPLPRKWQDAGLKSWADAFQNAQYRDRVEVIISKHR